MIFQVITLGIIEFYNAKDEQHLKENLLEINYDFAETEIIDISEETAKSIKVKYEESSEFLTLSDMAGNSQEFFLLATKNF